MDYGFAHDGKVVTPNQSIVDIAVNDARNKEIEARELELWDGGPDKFIAYYDEKRGQVSTWLGTVIGTIAHYRVYRHNFGGKFISMTVRGTNGLLYHGRASFDWGSVIRLTACRGRRTGQ